jgi:hypothetical protein
MLGRRPQPARRGRAGRDSASALGWNAALETQQGMMFSALGLVSFVAIFGGAAIGLIAARSLPEHHFSDETRTAVSLSATVLGTLAALVLGLLISDASDTFSTLSDGVTEISVDLIRIDRLLDRYGPGAEAAQARLLAYAEAKRQELFPAPDKPRIANDETARLLETTQDALLALPDLDVRHAWLRDKALELSDDLAQARWLLEQRSTSSIPVPFLLLLVFWLAIVFGCFGLFAPPNATAITTLFLCSVAISGGITMILELDQPFAGSVRISPAPMENAISLLGGSVVPSH